MSRLDEIQAKIAEHEAHLRAAEDDQKAVDLEAVLALKLEHGFSNVATINLPFTPGMVTMVAARAPTEPEVKRYRDRVRPPNGNAGDPVKAAEELAGACRVYPPKPTAPGEADAYEAVLKARPGVHVQLGVSAIKLAAGRASEQGKD